MKNKKYHKEHRDITTKKNFLQI